MSSRASLATPRATTGNTFNSQIQETQLNQSALVALETLRRQDASGHNNSLQATLDLAAKLLNEVVGEINDRASEARQRHQNRLNKLQQNGEQETEEEQQKYEALQQKVQTLTKSMDESVRKVVDHQTWAKGVPDQLRHVVNKSKEVQARNSRRRGHNPEDDRADNEADENDVAIQPGPGESATALLQAAQSTADTQWTAQSLTERYSQNDTYADFYKVKWDAQNHSEDPPPQPHPSMWFAHEEGRNLPRTTSNTQRQTQPNPASNDTEDTEQQPPLEDTSDTEIQLTSENKSCKCPLTFVFFEQPVTSTKCPHSFEKSAIIEYIRASPHHLPLTPAQLATLNARFPRGTTKGRPQAEAQLRSQNPKWAQCPVCVMQLTEHDVRDDALLLRMTKRAREAEMRAAEVDDAEEGEGEDDDSDEDILPMGTQRHKRRKVHKIGSSPVSGRRRTFVKPERAVSVVPNSQRKENGRRRGRVMDVEDDNDHDNEEG